MPIVHDNALYGNGGYQLENRTTASVSAEGNWWGTNTPTAGATFTGTIAYTPPIQLSVSRSPVSIPANGSSTSVVSALMTDGSGRYPPDGTYVSFTTTMGTVDSHLTEVESGAVGKEGQFLTSHAVPGASGGDLRWSNNPGDTITYTFTGDSIVYVYAMGSNCGYANVSVDGAPYSSIDMYSSTLGLQVERVIATDLGPGAHTITVSVAGTRNPHSSNFYVYADAFKVGTGDGVVSTTLTSGTVTGTAIVTATAPGPASVTTTVDFVSAVSTLTVTASPATLPVSNTAILTATAMDQYSNPLPSRVITFSTSSGLGSGGISPVTATTNVSGQAVSYISSTLAGPKLVMATAPNLVTGTTTVTFTAAPSAYVYLPIILKNYPPPPTPTPTPTPVCPSVEATVSVGSGPRGIAVITATNRIYVANRGSNSVSIIDGGTNTVVGTIDLSGSGSGPNGIAYHPSGFLYVSLADSDRVTIINASTGTVVGNVAVGDNPAGVAVNPVTGKVYVANFGSTSTALDTVSVISGDIVVGTIPVEDAPSQIAVNPVTNRIFVTNHGHGDNYGYGSSVSVIDGSTDTVIRTIRLVTGDPPTPGQGPHGIAVNPNTNKIYVAVIDSHRLVVIDGDNLDAPPTYIAPPLDVPLWMVAVNPDLNRVYATGSDEVWVHRVFVLDGATNTWLTNLNVGTNPKQGVAFNPETGRLYVSNEGSNNVTVIQTCSASGPLSAPTATATSTPTATATPTATPTGSPTATPTLPPSECYPVVEATRNVGANPHGVAVGNGKIYVANRSVNTVSVFRLSDYAWVRDIAVSGGPSGVAYDDRHQVFYVTQHDLNQMAVINSTTDAVITSVTVGAGPHGVAYNSTANKIYVANYDDDSVTILDGDTRALITTVTALGQTEPAHIAVNPVTNKVYVTYHGSGKVGVIDGNINAISIIDIYSAGPYGITVDTVRNLIYVATIDTHRIVAIGEKDGVPDTYLGWAEFHKGQDPAQPVPLRVVAVIPGLGASGHIFATTCSGDGGFDRLLAIPKGWYEYFNIPYAIDVGGNPQEGIAVAANRVFVTSRNANRLTIVADGEPPCLYNFALEYSFEICRVGIDGDCR